MKQNRALILLFLSLAIQCSAISPLAFCELMRLDSYYKCYWQFKNDASKNKKPRLINCGDKFWQQLQQCRTIVEQRNLVGGCALLPPPNIGMATEMPNEKNLARCSTQLFESLNRCRRQAEKVRRRVRQAFYRQCYSPLEQQMHDCINRYPANKTMYPPFQRPLRLLTVPWRAKKPIEAGMTVYACISHHTKKARWVKARVLLIKDKQVKVKPFKSKQSLTIYNEYVVPTGDSVKSAIPNQVNLEARRSPVTPILYRISPFMEKLYKDKLAGERLSDNTLSNRFKQEVHLPKSTEVSYEFKSGELYLAIKLNEKQVPLKLKLYTFRNQKTKTSWQCQVLSKINDNKMLPEICQLNGGSDLKALHGQTFGY